MHRGMTVRNPTVEAPDRVVMEMLDDPATPGAAPFGRVPDTINRLFSSGKWGRSQ